jgi:hypothetical protein
VLSREETERLAQAISAYRPDWPIGSLCTFIWARKERPYRDLALELTYVALDPATQTPARVDADGPWKYLQLATKTNTTSVLEHIDYEQACAVCLKDRMHLFHGGTGTPSDHDWEPPKEGATVAPSELRDQINRLVGERETA